MTVLAFALEAWSVIPSLISTGSDIIDFWNKTNAALEKMQTEDRNPSDDEWSALHKIIEDLRAQRPDV